MIFITVILIKDVRAIIISILEAEVNFQMLLDIDGAYFGTTFHHLFLMTYERSVPLPPTQSYVPRIFGFKIHNPLSGEFIL